MHSILTCISVAYFDAILLQRCDSLPSHPIAQASCCQENASLGTNVAVMSQHQLESLQNSNILLQCL